MAIIDPITRLEHYLAAVSDNQIFVPDPIRRIERYMNSILNKEVSDIEPITNIEYYLAKISGADVEIPEPILPVEFYLAAIAGADVDVPEPITRIDWYLYDWLENGLGELETVSGAFPLSLADALEKPMESLVQYGKCYQASTPTPSDPIEIAINNGTLMMVDDELPIGYKRLLGFSCNNNAMWEIADFHLKGSDTVRISFSVDAACNVFGCYQGTSDNDNYDLYVSTTSGSKYLRYGNGTYLSYWSNQNLGKRFDVVFTPTGTQGMPEDSTWTEMTFTSANDMLIGSTTTTGTSSKLKGKLFGNIIVDGRLKLIPCERISDNVLGYYDTVSDTFYEPYTGFDGAVSLGYDGSHYSLAVVGTDEVLTVSASGADSQTASVADLYAVGEAADEQEIVSGAVTRKCDTYIFDGSETFGSSSAYGTALYVASLSTKLKADKSVNPICTHFTTGAATGTQPDGSCFFNASGHFYFRTSDNATDFKAWLKGQYDSGTPVIIVFALADEKSESVTAQPLHTSDGTNTVSITAEISGIEAEIKYVKSK